MSTYNIDAEILVGRSSNRPIKIRPIITGDSLENVSIYVCNNYGDANPLWVPATNNLAVATPNFVKETSKWEIGIKIVAGSESSEAYVSKPEAYVATGAPDLEISIPAFSAATDAEIAAVAAALDANKLSIAETGWQIGDERIGILGAMPGNGVVGESNSKQKVTWVIMDSQHYELTTPVASGNMDHFVLGLKNCLLTQGYMNPSNTNSGSWNSCRRRTWCNTSFRNGISEEMRPAFKQFKVITASEYNATTTTITNDYFALFANKEVFNSQNSSNATEAGMLTQIAYYASGNKVKKAGDNGSAINWWERSPNSGSSSNFCRVGSGGNASGDNASYACGLAPFGCI